MHPALQCTGPGALPLRHISISARTCMRGRLQAMAVNAKQAEVAANTATFNKWVVNGASPSTVASNTERGIYVNSHFDSGNIEVQSMTDTNNIQLKIHKDPFCAVDNRAHFQYFNFRVTGAKDTPLTLNIVNAGKASYPAAWNGYQACISYDLKHWFRAHTTYDAEAGVLTISHTPKADAMQVAYFAPYTYDRHTQLIAEMQVKEGVRLLMIGETLDGHDLDLLRVGEPGPGKRTVWITARQHPGESQAEWFAEGLLRRLTDPHDAVARSLLRHAVFYVVPNVNPDGTWRGHLRTNAAGINLNRAWADPNPEDSPEVYNILRQMDETGVDMLVDVHGDEELPHCFIAGAEGVPSWGERLARLQGAFTQAFVRASPDFQTEKGYAKDDANQANMKICSNAVADRFNCLAVTLEMPFKDTEALPDPVQGWSPERSMKLGAAMLTAVHDVLPILRD